MDIKKVLVTTLFVVGQQSALSALDLVSPVVTTGKSIIASRPASAFAVGFLVLPAAYLSTSSLDFLWNSRFQKEKHNYVSLINQGVVSGYLAYLANKCIYSCFGKAFNGYGSSLGFGASSLAMVAGFVFYDKYCTNVLDF